LQPVKVGGWFDWDLGYRYVSNVRLACTCREMSQASKQRKVPSLNRTATIAADNRSKSEEAGGEGEGYEWSEWGESVSQFCMCCQLKCRSSSILPTFHFASLKRLGCVIQRESVTRLNLILAHLIL